MIKVLRTAASGMAGQQLNVDNIANNLANVNTTGFKRTKIEFQDVMYQSLRRPGVATTAGSVAPTSLDIGYGSKPISSTRQFHVGELQQTGNPVDLAIDGDGFFQGLMPDGTPAYMRDGSLKLSGEGRIVTSDGFFMQPEITISEDAVSIAIGFDGKVSVMQAADDMSSLVNNLKR